MFRSHGVSALPLASAVPRLYLKLPLATTRAQTHETVRTLNLAADLSDVSASHALVRFGTNVFSVFVGILTKLDLSFLREVPSLCYGDIKPGRRALYGSEE
jgi:hypothetical protein